jgi:hypothetical protein
MPTRPSESISTWSSRWRFTLIGAAAGPIVVGIWTATFQPHGGVELSSYLFPLSAWLLGEVIFRHDSIPVLVWYGSALSHWAAVGCVIDFFRNRMRTLRR